MSTSGRQAQDTRIHCKFHSIYLQGFSGLRGWYLCFCWVYGSWFNIWNQYPVCQVALRGRSQVIERNRRMEQLLFKCLRRSQVPSPTKSQASRTWVPFLAILVVIDNVRNCGHRHIWQHPGIWQSTTRVLLWRLCDIYSIYYYAVCCAVVQQIGPCYRIS